MAMIDCPECGKQISDKAPACPNCGVPVSSVAQAKTPSSKGSSLPRLIGFGLLIVLLFVLWLENANNRGGGALASLIPPQPVKLVNESIQLNEGQSMIYPFTLNRNAKVQVQINAEPKDVDVMLMTAVQAQRFKDVSGNLFGGDYTYTQELSGQHILTMDRTATLSPGEWSIVVMRPVEAILFHDTTAVQTVLTAY